MNSECGLQTRAPERGLVVRSSVDKHWTRDGPDAVPQARAMTNDERSPNPRNPNPLIGSAGVPFAIRISEFHRHSDAHDH